MLRSEGGLLWTLTSAGIWPWPGAAGWSPQGSCKVGRGGAAASRAYDKRVAAYRKFRLAGPGAAHGGATASNRGLYAAVGGAPEGAPRAGVRPWPWPGLALPWAAARCLRRQRRLFQTRCHRCATRTPRAGRQAGRVGRLKASATFRPVFLSLASLGECRRGRGRGSTIISRTLSVVSPSAARPTPTTAGWRPTFV